MNSRILLGRLVAVTIGGLDLTSHHAVARDTVISEPDIKSSRYEMLWTKSPFAVAATEQAMTSTQYQLVGIAKIDEISYANLIDNQSQQHFLLSTLRPDRGLKLISIERSHDALPGFAILQKGGQQMRLEMEALTSGLATANSPTAPAVPANPLSTPSLANIPSLMPVGGSLPLVFQTVDFNRVHLTVEQVAVIDRLRQDFTKAVTHVPRNNANSNSGNIPQLKNWESAQQQSDERCQLLLGSDAFSQYQMAVSRPTTQ